MEKDTKGHLHIMTQAIRDMVQIFDEMGFAVVTGPELETEFHNFNALNIPETHPSRDMQDTFWIKTKPDEEKKVLRTQTSDVQIRFMEKMKNNMKPFKIIIPGKVFRNEATDATHEAQFHQMECLYVNKNVSLTELKGTLEVLFKKFLGDETKVRFRPSYFPFVEPGVEVDVRWRDQWLEVGGAGIVHQNVFKAVGIDSDEWQGFAFGMGIDRLVMIRYGIDDIRHLYSGDLRLINQF